jgi:acetyltransferase-like isoleucine patch superfamily enzyme
MIAAEDRRLFARRARRGSRRGARRLRGCARRCRGEVRAAEPDAARRRLARQRLGEAGHPARLPLRRRRPTCRSITGGCRSSTRTRCRSSARPSDDGVRVVPGGSSIRDGAYLGRGVICMPPMYINIGAYVGEGTLIDSHALVGSCAQVGARVHVSAAAQIGGVLEPVGALPVIVEDDVLVGGNCGIYEGAVVKRRAVLAPARSSRARRRSTTCRTTGSSSRGRAARRPRGRRGRARRARGDDRTDTRGRSSRRGSGRSRLARPPLIDIDSTTGREADVGRVLSAYLRERGYSSPRTPSTTAVRRSRGEGGRFNIIAAAGEPHVVFSTHFDCVPPFFASRVEGELLHGRGACDAKGILAAQIAAAERLRAEGETRVGLVFVAGEERGSDGAMAVNADGVAGEVSRQRRTDGQSPRRRHARRLSRPPACRGRRAAHSGYPELGESAIEKLVDALVRLRDLPLPADPDVRHDDVQRRAHRGRRRTERGAGTPPSRDTFRS